MTTAGAVDEEGVDDTTGVAASSATHINTISQKANPLSNSHALTATPVDGATSVLIVNGHALAPQVVAVVQFQVALGPLAVRLAQRAYQIGLIRCA